ncbi:MAG TPA: hypothetical protein VJH92_02855 [Candidatus Nanoarchaeia archaeon]|nr:hypothetical protein [Candidatus Nanoarchaeia archaeon]
METRLIKIEEDIKIIRENHLAHIEISLAKNTVDTEWLKDNHKAMRNMLYSIIGGIILTIILVAFKLQ